MLFAYDLFLYSQAELLRGMSHRRLERARHLNAFAVPLIAIAVRRNPQWSLDVFVSRQVVFYTTTVLGVGAYLTVMALGGYYVREIGGDWGSVGQIVFFAGAAVVLASLVASRGAAAARARVHQQAFLSQQVRLPHRVAALHRHAVLDRRGDVRRTAVRAMAQIFASPGGILFLRDETGSAVSCRSPPGR